MAQEAVTVSQDTALNTYKEKKTSLFFKSLRI